MEPSLGSRRTTPEGAPPPLARQFNFIFRHQA
jgi:hypothetical protein